MLHRSAIALGALFLVMAGAGVAASATPYMITDLGVNPYGMTSPAGLGSSPPYLMSVNNRGEVALTTYVDSKYRSLLYTSGTMVNLTAMFTPNTNAGCSVGINNNGVVAGHSWGVVSLAPHGYLYSGGSAGSFIDLKTDATGIANGHTCYAYGVNDSGWATGNAVSSTTPTFNSGFLYSNRAGTWTTEDIGNGGFGFSTTSEIVAGRAVNSSGQVAAQDHGSISINMYDKAFVWTPGAGGSAGSAVALPEMAAPSDINDSGVVVGCSGSEFFGSNKGQAMLEVPSGGSYTPTYIPFLGTGNVSRATGISNDGAVVGWSYLAGSAGDQHAFVYSGGATTDLNTAGTVLNLGGWTLQYAMGISDNGRCLVGYGTNGSGQTSTFLLQAAMSGDANLDGKVDVSDLGKVLTNYNKSGMQWADGDFDQSGAIDVTDLSKVLTNYDKSFATGRVNSVPEPSSLAIVSIVAITLCLVLKRPFRNMGK